MKKDESNPERVYRRDVESAARRFPRVFADSLRSQSFLVSELMDCVEDLILVLDPRRRIVMANRWAALSLGYTQRDLLSMRLDDLVEGGAEAAEGLALASRSSFPGRWAGECRLSARGGAILRLRLSVSPLGEAEDAGSGRLLVGRVLRDQAGQEAWTEAPGLAERLLRDLGQPLLIVDGASRTVRDCNEAATDFLGLARERLLGTRLLDHAEDGETHMQKADAAYARSGLYLARVRFSCGDDGRSVPCDFVGAPLYRRDGTLSAIVAILLDRGAEEAREAELSELVHRVSVLAGQLSELAVVHQHDRQPRELSTLGFTRRQIEIARRVAEGATAKEIGFRLGIAESTVKNHLAVIYRKLGVSSRLAFLQYIVDRRVRFE